MSEFDKWYNNLHNLDEWSHEDAEKGWQVCRDKILEILHKNANMTEQETEYLCDVSFNKVIKQIEKL